MILPLIFLRKIEKSDCKIRLMPYNYIIKNRKNQEDKEMKYGSYELKMENVTTYHCFKLSDNAEFEGFIKIGEAKTLKEGLKNLSEQE